MAFSPTIQSTLTRHQTVINEALHAAIARTRANNDNQQDVDLQPYYGQIEYHLGWVDSHLVPVANHPGKLLRPTLLLLAYEAAGAWNLIDQAQTHQTDYLRRALPAAVAVELTHNFTLIHDDIEDGDAERRHRETLWKLWGIPQAINTGDGLFALARLTLWGVLDEGVEGSIAARLGAALDHACLVLSEGQYLDISFESQPHIPVSIYIDMIGRKTAALMGCAAEMGAMLGTLDQVTIQRLRSFGYAMGVAFQVRDDLLGVWASTAELGKTPAGDIYRRKKSLPFLHALEHANAHDQHILRSIYQQDTPITQAQVNEVLTVFEHTSTNAYCRSFLAQQCQLAYQALASVPRTNNPIAARALNDLKTLVHFVEAATH